MFHCLNHYKNIDRKVQFLMPCFPFSSHILNVAFDKQSGCVSWRQKHRKRINSWSVTKYLVQPVDAKICSLLNKLQIQHGFLKAHGGKVHVLWSDFKKTGWFPLSIQRWLQYKCIRIHITGTRWHNNVLSKHFKSSASKILNYMYTMYILTVLNEIKN